MAIRAILHHHEENGDSTGDSDDLEQWAREKGICSKQAAKHLSRLFTACEAKYYYNNVF